MAWAVYAIARGQRGIALLMLALTFCGGIGFMGIKTVEYYSKYQHDLMIGTTNAFYQTDGTFTHPDGLKQTTEYIEYKAGHDVKGHGSDRHADTSAQGHAEVAKDAVTAHAQVEAVHADPTHGNPASAATAEGMAKTPTALVWPPRPVDHSTIAPASNVATSVAERFMQILPAVAKQPAADDHAVDHGSHYPRLEELDALNQQRLHLFFQIYFVMTGLHGLHVLIGMAIIGWVFLKTLGGAFSPGYYAPVEITGLYWHLVDLIWIFLFPLLYLIH
jgi:cytochrome c oxidase subunit 3